MSSDSKNPPSQQFDLSENEPHAHVADSGTHIVMPKAGITVSDLAGMHDHPTRSDS